MADENIVPWLIHNPAKGRKVVEHYHRFHAHYLRLAFDGMALGHPLGTHRRMANLRALIGM